jgi:hypothetical protein
MQAVGKIRHIYDPNHISATLSQPMQVFKIVPTVQQYDWGKLGTSSKVAVFAQSAGIPDFYVDESKPYAEVRVYRNETSHRS